MPSNEAPYVVRLHKDNTDSPMWVKDVEAAIRPEARKMLEEYARIPPEKVVFQVEQARERAWDLGPYASVGSLTWLNAYIPLHPAHDTVLQKLKSGASILDCACFFAPDLRHLAYEGAPTEQMYGFDLRPEYFDMAFDLYNDRESWKGTFFGADALRDFSTTRLGEFEGKMDILLCSKYLHLYDRAGQVDAAARLVKLLKPRAGSMFVGSQNGFPGSKEIPLEEGSFPGQGKAFLLGDVETIEGIWKDVGERTGTKWEFEARLLDFRTVGRHVDDGSEYSRLTGYNLQWTATLVEPAAR